MLCYRDEDRRDFFEEKAQRIGINITSLIRMTSVEDFYALWDLVLQDKVKTIIFVSLLEIPVAPEKFLRFLLDCIDKNILVISLHEEWFNNAFRDVDKRDMLKKFAELLLNLKRKKTSEAVKQVILELKKKGVKIGRPRKEIPVEEILELLKKKYSISEIARFYGVSRSTIYRRLKELGIKTKRKKRKH